MSVARAFPTTSNAEFVIVDSDHELTLGIFGNLVISHWTGPHNARNGRRLEKVLRAEGNRGAIGFVTIVEPSSVPPDNAERARITAVVDDLPIIAVGALVRGSALRKNFITMVMTAMLFLVRNELASRVSFCKNEMELALWIAGQVPRAPSASALADVLSRL